MILPYIFFEVSRRCNLSCNYCYFYSKIPPKEMRTNEVKDFLCVFHHKFGGNKVVFTGGEALLRKDIFNILAYAKMREIYVHLTTNGSTINSINIQKIKKVVDSITVSFNGKKPSETGIDQLVNDKIIEGINLTLDYDVPLYFHTTITKSNFEIIDELIDIAKSLNVGGMDFNVVSTNDLVLKNQRNGQSILLDQFELDFVYELLSARIKETKKLNISHHLIGIKEIHNPRCINRCLSPLWTAKPDGSIYPMIDLDKKWEISSDLNNFSTDSTILKKFYVALNNALERCCDLISFQKRKVVNYFRVIKECLGESYVKND